MAPQTLMTAFIVTPHGEVKLDVGALHGRSEIESQVELVRQKDQVTDGKTYGIVWVAVELDSANKPVRYKGLSVCELLVNQERRIGYKNLAEHVNRMAEAIRGGVNVGRLQPEARTAVKQQLVSIKSDLWERSSYSFKQALES